jgi:Spy/CpxP family protein refolding chaperone
MKAKILFLAIILFAAVSVELLNAQSRMQSDCRNLPGLTEDQGLRLNELRTQQLAASNHHRAAMGELRARKRSLSLSESPDMNAINAVIDQMERQRADHIKAMEAHRQQVRSLLNPEQRAIFDSRHIYTGQGRGSAVQQRRGSRSDMNNLGRGRRR